MKIDFKYGLYYAADADALDNRLLMEAGWKKNSLLKGMATSDILRLPPFQHACVGEAKTRVDKFVSARKNAIAASSAIDSDLVIPVPEGLEYRGYQKAGIAFSLARANVLNADVPRLGKCHPLNELVLTPSGWRDIGNLSVGDHVTDSGGTSSVVTGVFPQGQQDTYAVGFYDGTVVRCGLDHLWTVTNKLWKGDKTRTLPLREIVETGLFYGAGARKKPRFSVPLVFGPVEFAPTASVPVDPYVLGALIGDGYLAGGSVVISVPPEKAEVLERIQKTWKDITGPHGGRCPQYRLIGSAHKSNPLKDALERLGLRVNSPQRFIPDLYKFADPATRFALLQGLFDTDGSSKKGRTTYFTSSRTLAEDVAFMCRCFGAIARVNTYDRGEKGIDYAVSVTSDICFFHINEKRQHWKAPSNQLRKLIKSVEHVGDAEHVCISVDSPDHLYVTSGVTLTHNTIQTLGVANATPNLKNTLIVCQANTKTQWMKEWKKWTVHPHLSVDIIEGSNNPKPDVAIINYDILSRHKEWLQERDWDFIGVDEAHNLGSTESIRTEVLLGKGRKPASIPLRAKRRLFLTGSPIYTRPIGMWPIVRACDPGGLGDNWWDYVQRYCGASKENGWDASASTNEEQLQFKLRSSFMIRREKSDVMDEIPPNRQTVVLPQRGLERLVRAEMQEFADRLAQFERDQLPEDTLRNFIDEAELLATPTTRQDLALAKLNMCIEWVQEFLQGNPREKIILFIHHRAVAERLREAFPGAACIIGGMSPKKRDAEKDRFQEDAACRVLIGNIRAAGTGVSFSAADTVVFIELSWSPAEVDQAEERPWLPEKTRPISIYRLVVENSLDMALCAVLDRRQASISRTLSKRFIGG